MANVMAILLRVVDGWYELANDGRVAPYDDTDRLEVLGHLVRLVARRFHGFRELPHAADVSLDVHADSFELRIRSPRRVPLSTETIERQLSRYGFVVYRPPGTDNRELALRCSREPGATVLDFEESRRAAPRLRKR